MHELGAFTVGGLNCWENWMPLPRAELYGMGEDLHVAIWPGSKRNTHDITRHIAKEGRSFVLSVSGLMRPSDFPKNTPYLNDILKACGDEEFLADGGSCLCGPDGEWIIEPQVGKKGFIRQSLIMPVCARKGKISIRSVIIHDPMWPDWWWTGHGNRR